MECQLCQYDAREEKLLCKRCESILKDNLSEIPELHVESKGFLVPGRTGSGSPTTERSIGFNVSAMDYSMATDLLPMLHRYEAMIRKGRNLTPPALLRKYPTIEEEVAATIQFHLTHLGWSTQQVWIGDFAKDVREQHAKGTAVTKRFIEKPRRIPCPTDKCKAKIAIDIENILSDVFCVKCKSEWTLYRLIQLALNNPDKRFWLDIEAICLWLNLTKREVLKIVDSHNVPKRQGLYDVAKIVEMRNAS